MQLEIKFVEPQAYQTTKKKKKRKMGNKILFCSLIRRSLHRMLAKTRIQQKTKNKILKN